MFWKNNMFLAKLKGGGNHFCLPPNQLFITLKILLKGSLANSLKQNLICFQLLFSHPLSWVFNLRSFQIASADGAIWIMLTRSFLVTFFLLANSFAARAFSLPSPLRRNSKSFSREKLLRVFRLIFLHLLSLQITKF